MVMSLALHSRPDHLESLEIKFREYVEYEETRIDCNLKQLVYTIGDLKDVHILAGIEPNGAAPVRIEKVRDSLYVATVI